MKLGQVFKTNENEYILVDLRITFPNGIFGESFEDEPFCLLSKNSTFKTFNGTFANINDLVNEVNLSIKSNIGKRFNYRWE